MYIKLNICQTKQHIAWACVIKRKNTKFMTAITSGEEAEDQNLEGTLGASKELLN